MNVFEKIHKVMQDVGYLSKDDAVSTGAGKAYRAISEEKVTSTVRQSLIRHGLVILPVKQNHTRTDERVVDSSGKEKINRLTAVDVTYRICNVEDKDDYIEVQSSGTGADTQDKGVGKAMTYAYKYMLLRTFAIPTGEDPDKISSELYSQQLQTPAEEIQPLADQAHLAAIRTGLVESGTEESDLLKAVSTRFQQQVTALEQLTVPMVRWVLACLEKKLAQKRSKT